MMVRAFLSAVIVFASVQLACAQTFPRHKEICIGDVVSKEKLAKAFLKNEPDWLNLYIGSVESAANPTGAPQWQRIFADGKFCANNQSCLAPDPTFKPKGDEKPPINTVAAEGTLDELRRAFQGELETATRPGGNYSLSGSSVGPGYFADPKTQLLCLPNEPPVVAKVKGIDLPVRLRANSDDLNIKGSDPAFRNVKPATINFKRDGVEQKTNTTSLQATIGYPIPLTPFVKEYLRSGDLSSFGGELIPYVSATQSLSKVDGKPSTYAETNNVAVGAMLTFDATFGALPGVDHFVMAKPQYFWNTKDKSEIASLRFIYQPWTNRIPAINKPFPIWTDVAFLDGTSLTLLFDLRDQVGQYVKTSMDPKKALMQTSFHRAGSRFGFALATDAAKGVHTVLTVTQTMLYGFSGSVRRLSLFDASLSFYFDKTSNFAFTVGYTKGQDEDTTERSQNVTAGLSAKF